MNHSLKSLKMVLGAVILCSLGFVSAAGAQSSVMLGYKTFSGPVRVPGTILPTGTYVFERVGSDRQFVRISTKQGKQLAVVMVSTTAPQAVGTSGRGEVRQVTFRRTAPGTAPALHTVFFGEQGFQFLYSAEEENAMQRDLKVTLAQK